MTESTPYRITPGWRTLLVDLGIRPGNVLRRAGMPDDLFSRPETRLTSAQYFAFWRALEEEAADPLLPIHIGERLTAENFAPPLFAALCSPNLRVALERIAHYKRLIGPMRLRVEDMDDGVRATFRSVDVAASPPTAFLYVELVFLVQVARMATRRRVEPLAVTAPSPPVEASAYRRHFGVAVAAGSSPSVHFAAVDVDRPFLTANESMWAMFEPELRRRLAALEEEASTVERVRAALLESLPSGQPSMEAIAGRLATSKRTLQRRLKGEGSSYQRVLGETRERLALHYLANTRLSCAEIAFLLGYEEPNSFFRAFHQWTGDSPEHRRQRMATMP
jgi:AraC-like DNA-binding protein